MQNLQLIFEEGDVGGYSVARLKRQVWSVEVHSEICFAREKTCEDKSKMKLG